MRSVKVMGLVLFLLVALSSAAYAEGPSAARSEEEALKEQIKQAFQAGDKEKANELLGQLQATHKDNVLDKIQERREIKSEKEALKEQIKEALQSGDKEKANELIGQLQTARKDQEINQDLRDIRQDKQEIKDSSSAARSEEEALKEQIKQAFQSGDKEKANELLGQFQTTHKDNVKDKVHDIHELNQDRRELKQDIKTRKEGRIGRR